jgi:hypothetical protein
MDGKSQSKTEWGKDRQRKEKQIGEQIQSGSETDGKPQSKTEWERTDKGRRNK